jgi:hypothetical protein
MEQQRGHPVQPRNLDASLMSINLGPLPQECSRLWKILRSEGSVSVPKNRKRRSIMRVYISRIRRALREGGYPFQIIRETEYCLVAEPQGAEDTPERHQ